MTGSACEYCFYGLVVFTGEGGVLDWRKATPEDLIRGRMGICPIGWCPDCGGTGLNLKSIQRT